MKKILFIIPLVIVSLFGFILNGNYYQYYFKDANYQGNMPLYMAMFFISSEIMLWSFSSKKNTISIILKYGLVVFSIFATLSSQFASTSEKVSESAQTIYERIDNSADIERYENQIKIQDTRINNIYEERKEKSYYGLTDDELDFAQSEKLRYENLLDGLKDKDEKEIQSVYSEKSIYGWLAGDLPRIFKSGLNEEFVRIIFQLFSSIILAAMSPVCISIIRGYKTHTKKPAAIAPEPVKGKLPKKTEKIVTPPPVKAKSKITLSVMDKKNILKMLLFRFDEIGLILQPEDAVEKFISVNKDRPEIRAYTLKECKLVYGELTGKTIAGKNKDKIIKELMG